MSAVIEKEYLKKYPDDKNMKNWTSWYAQGHFDYLFNGGSCDDEDNGEKAKFLYNIIKRHLTEALSSKYKYVKILAVLIKNNKNLKIKKKRFEIGDIVGVCSDCMSEFQITGFEKKDYKAKCIKLYHPNPKESAIEINKEYLVKDSQIVNKLSSSFAHK